MNCTVVVRKIDTEVSQLRIDFVHFNIVSFRDILLYSERYLPGNRWIATVDSPSAGSRAAHLIFRASRRDNVDTDTHTRNDVSMKLIFFAQSRRKGERKGRGDGGVYF